MSALVTDNALSTLAADVSLGATSFAIASGDGVLFPAIASPDYAYLTLGPDPGEVIKCTALSSDTFTCEATTSTHSTGDRVMLTVGQSLLDEMPRLISTNLTLTVAASGAMFGSLTSALAWLADKIIAADATVTISIGDGTYTHTAPIVSDHPMADRIYITGANTYDVTFSSIQSGTGSSGNHLLVLNVSNVSNIAVNDYVLIYEASGGTNPYYLSGCHKVTEVDGANVRITINSYHLASVRPSGSCSGTLTVIKTVLAFTACDGFRSGGRWFKQVDKIILQGDGTTSTAGLRPVGSPLMWSVDSGFLGPVNTGIVNFQYGAYVSFSPSCSIYQCCLSKFSHSPLFVSGGTLKALACVVTGGIGNSGNKIYGGSGVFNTNGGRVMAYSLVATGNYWYAAFAERMAYTYIAGATTVGNLNGTLDPAANTQGNEYGYNDQ